MSEVQRGRLRSEGGVSVASGLSGCEFHEDGQARGRSLVPAATGVFMEEGGQCEGKK